MLKMEKKNLFTISYNPTSSCLDFFKGQLHISPKQEIKYDRDPKELLTPINS